MCAVAGGVEGRNMIASMELDGVSGIWAGGAVFEARRGG